MKKIYTFLLLLGFGLQLVYAQFPDVDVAVENPRIIGNTFNFDIYIKRTNDDNSIWGVFGGDSAMLGDGSWVFTYNLADLAFPPTITYTNPVLFPPALNYAFTFYTYLGIYMEVNHTKPLFIIPGDERNMVLDKWYHMFTVSAVITGNASNLSNLVWDPVSTAFTTILNISNQPINFYDSDCDIALNTKSWTGAADTDWDNNLNWSPNNVPTSSDDIIYPNNPQREVDAYGMASHYGIVNDLRVNHFAQLKIINNRGITVTGDIVLKGDTNIVLESTTNVLPSIYSSALIPEGTINYNGYSLETGHIEVHRTLYHTSTSANFYMHQVAAPVDGVILDDWDMQHDYTYAYEFNTTLQDWWNIYVPSRLTPPGYGFVLSLWNIATPSTEDVVFYDNLVLANVTPTFTIGAGDNALLGNPYTAPIDWESMMPQTNINNTVYVWNPGGGPAGYATYTAGSGGNLSACYVQPGQSFFIEATGAATQFNITTADRTQNIQPYLKEDFPNLLRIYTEGGNETSDEAYIRFKEGDNVTAAYDIDHDGQKYPSAYEEFATEINTVTTDGVSLTVDARPMIVDDQVSSIPLSFKPTIEAEYKMHADEESMTTFDQSIKIMLEDTFHPELDWTDLRAEGYYTFNATPDDDYDRFILHFYDSDFGIEDGLAYKPIKIYSDRTDAFIINDSEQLIKEIHVYDITGNLMASKSMVNDAVTRMYVSDQTGYYVVKVITDKAVYSEKVLITK